MSTPASWPDVTAAILSLTAEQFKGIGLLVVAILFFVFVFAAGIRGMLRGLPRQKGASEEGIRSCENSIPVSINCPVCGSSNHRRADPGNEFKIRADRVCKDCQTVYSPPVPKWAAVFSIPFGVALIVLGPLVGYVASRMQLEYSLAVVIAVFMVVMLPCTGIIVIREGIKSLRDNRDNEG